MAPVRNTGSAPASDNPSDIGAVFALEALRQRPIKTLGESGGHALVQGAHQMIVLDLRVPRVEKARIKARLLLGLENGAAQSREQKERAYGERKKYQERGGENCNDEIPPGVFAAPETFPLLMECQTSPLVCLLEEAMAFFAAKTT